MENLIHKYKDGQRKMKWSSFQLFSFAVTQHPPMHQLWMKLFWLFWDEHKPVLNQTKH
jgi:hypothetical protein